MMQQNRRHAGMLAVLILVALAIPFAPACTTPTEDSLRELREYSLDEEIPRDERVGRLQRIAANDDERSHIRATAIQMLGLLQVEEAQPTMFAILGDASDARSADNAEAADSERLRFEAVIALSRFGTPDIYDKLYRLLYRDARARENSALVLRQFVQGFQFAPAWPNEQAPEVSEVLLRWVQVALERNESDSLVARATNELRRLTGRPDLDAADGDAWQRQIESMRRARSNTPTATAESDESGAPS